MCRTAQEKLSSIPDGVHSDSERDAVMHYLVGCTGGFRDDVFSSSPVSCGRSVRGHGYGLKGIAEIIRNDPRVAAEFIVNVLQHGCLLESAGFVYWTTPRGEQWIEISDRDGGEA